MPGRHEVHPRTLPGRRTLAALLAAAVAIATLFFSVQPAQAATRDAQISLTGLVDDNNPTGGSQLGIKPGDTIRFKASAAPTQKVQSLVGQLGLGGLLGSLLDSAASFQVTADFSGLPGGKAKTVLKGSSTESFTFPNKGTYTFTWTADRIGLLGNLIPIELDGNQLKKAGLELNAQNEYVGKIVVATNPPKGGISVQLPSISVKPKVGPIQLPKVGVPGVNVPTIPVPSLPNLNLPKPGSSKPSSSAPGKNSSSTNGYELPGLTIPDQVVPNGDSGGGAPAAGGAGGGGLQQAAPNGDTGVFTGTLPGNGSSKSAAAGGSGSDDQAGTNGQRTVDLATDAGSPSSQVPVILAILAIIALALVAGTYARLFLLKQKS